MGKKKLHPSVEEFKEFVKKNPKIVQEVRNGNASWQELFEDWYLLGEEDSRWDSFKMEKQDEEDSKEKKADWVSNVMGSLKQMDPNQMQGYIDNLSQALSAVQGVISQFQGGGKTGGSKSSSNQRPNNPFVFRKD